MQLPYAQCSFHSKSQECVSARVTLRQRLLHRPRPVPHHRKKLSERSKRQGGENRKDREYNHASRPQQLSPGRFAVEQDGLVFVLISTHARSPLPFAGLQSLHRM